jgi:xylulokinase
LSRDHMPRLLEGTQVSGTLRPEVAKRWGMAAVPVAAGAGDNAAGAVGIGVTGEGDALLSLGTSGVTFVATEAFRADPANAVHAFCHCLPGKWHQMAVHLSAASCIDWAAIQLELDGPGGFFAALEQAGQAAEGEELFLPFLSGERTPHNNPHLRAGWFDLDHATTPARLAWAVLEGVAFAHADGLDILRGAGSAIDRLSVIGGGARSPLWGRILAAALDAELDYLDGGEVGPALGAARLARIAATGEDPGTVCSRPPVIDTIRPDPRLADRLASRRGRFRAIVAAFNSI